MKRALILVLLLSSLGCDSKSTLPQRSDVPAQEIEIADVWVRAMPDRAITRTAAYLSITNHGDHHDGLVGVDAVGVESVEMHETVVEGDVMRMRRVDAVELPPHEKVELTPGGHHIMLIGVTRPLAEGDSVALTLRFASGKQTSLTAPVRPI